MDAIRKLVLLSAVLFALSGVIAIRAVPQQQPAYCDNYPQGKGKNTDHKCECERTTMDCDKDPNDPATVYISAKCSTKCHPDHCKCLNTKCS